jgi:hypothetical protein
MSDSKLAYLKSARFKLLSWTSGAVALSGFYFKDYQLALFVIGAGIGFVAIMPAYTRDRFERKAGTRDIAIMVIMMAIMVGVAFYLTLRHRHLPF